MSFVLSSRALSILRFALFLTINRSTSLSSVGLPHAYEPNKTILSGWYSWTIFSAMGFNFSSINFLDFINIFNYTINHLNIPRALEHCKSLAARVLRKERKINNRSSDNQCQCREGDKF